MGCQVLRCCETWACAAGMNGIRRTLCRGCLRIRRQLEINRNSGIHARTTVLDWENGFIAQPTPPSIKMRSNLASAPSASTSRSAPAARRWLSLQSHLKESLTQQPTPARLAAVPGFDRLVAETLDPSSSVEHTLLQGVGCAGVILILRTAAQVAAGATAHGKPARVLTVACEPYS